jgi:hypothetical protein
MKLYELMGGEDIRIARDMFLVLQRLGLIDRTTSFQEFVEWMGDLSWYATTYKPR